MIVFEVRSDIVVAASMAAEATMESAVDRFQRIAANSKVEFDSDGALQRARQIVQNHQLD